MTGVEYNVHVAGVPHSGNRYTCAVLEAYGLQPRLQHFDGVFDMPRVVPTRHPRAVLESSWRRTEVKTTEDVHMARMIKRVLNWYSILSAWCAKVRHEFIQFRVGEDRPAELAQLLGFRLRDVQVEKVGQGEGETDKIFPPDFVLPAALIDHAHKWGYNA